MRRWLAAILLLLAACGEGGPHVVLPEGETLQIVLLGTQSQQASINLPPSDPRYQRFQGWLAVNGRGWYQYYLTPPSSSGILILAGPLRLHFVGSRAIVTTDRGVFEKSVQESDYAYLVAREPGT
jgi:hypothetical protein